jgi:hypothetical protein
MNIKTIFPLLLISLVAISLATTQRASATAPRHGALASGEGAFTFFNGFRTEQWSYSFSAVTNPNGHVHGRATFEIAGTSIPTVTHVVVKINCLNILGSPENLAASIMGTVLQSDNPEFPKHANVVFGAEDNSGSPDNHPDIITRLFVFPGDCSDFAFPLTFFNQNPDAIHIEP